MPKGLLIGLGFQPKKKDEEKEESMEEEEDDSSSMAAARDVASLIKDSESSEEDIAQALKDAIYVCLKEKEEEED